MVKDLQQFDASQGDNPMELSSISNVHVKEADVGDMVKELQQLGTLAGDGALGMSTVSNVHVG